MPFVTVEIMVGRTASQRRSFAEAVATAAVRHLDADPAKVRVRFAELSAGDLFRGDELLAGGTHPDR